MSVGGKIVGDDHRLASSMLEGEAGSSLVIVTRDSTGMSQTLTLVRQLAIVPTPSNLPTEAGFGVRIEREQGSKDARIVCIAEGSAAAVGGDLQEGDVVSQIDGKSVVGMACRFVLHTL